MLLTKIHIPPLQEQIVNRLELFKLLNKSNKHKLTLVSAPAGFGKTTLISTWIHQQNVSAAWFSVSNEDNDPVSFFSYLISAFGQLKKDFGKAALELLHSSNNPSVRSILNIVINELIELKKDVFFIIDDFHLIENNEINELLNHFLNFLPENIHLVILTRCDPNLQLSRLRSQLQLLEIRADNLSFTKTETAQLIKRHLKLPLKDTAIKKLFSKTEGWIAGLQLAVISLQSQNDPDSFIEEFSGSNLYIMEYLLDEVLEKQQESIKTFFVCTSILEILSTPLCNYLLDRNDCQMILNKLEARNMFIFPLDNSRQSYRYHHLFAELLQQKLSEYDESFVNKLHEKAATWYNNNNMPVHAIQHTLKTKDHQKSIALFSQNIFDLWNKGQHNTILDIAHKIPQSFLFNSSQICLYYAWILLDQGKLTDAYTYLEHGEKNCREYLLNTGHTSTEKQRYKILLGKIAIAFARYYAHTPDTEKILLYNSIGLEHLSNKDSFWLAWSCFTTVTIQTSQNDVPTIIQTYNKGLAYAKRSNNLYLVSLFTISLGYFEFRLGQLNSSYNRSCDLLAYLNKYGYLQYSEEESSFSLLYASMAIIEFYRADLKKAIHNITIALQLVEKDTNITNTALVLIAHSLIDYLTGDKIRSWEKIEKLETILNHNEVLPDVLTLYISWKGFFLVSQNDLNEAELFFDEYQIDINNTIPVSDVHRYTPLALWLIYKLRFNEAEDFLLQLHRQMQKLQRIEHLVEINILLACLYLQKADKKQALKSLEESMEYASIENILAYYILYDRKINSLYKETFKTISTKKTNISASFIKNLKTALVNRKQQSIQKNNIELSDRELDVLKLIDNHFTNQQIADSLFISLNTVKTHVKNILLKLDVDKRSKASDKARDLGIV